MIKSKKIKKKHLRKRSSSVLDEEENVEETSNLIQEAMEIRKFRKRPEGMETKDLSIGEENQKPIDEGEEKNKEQVSKNFGDNGIVSSFKTQTNYMDTEKLMNKYIEDEIRKKRGEKIEKEEEIEVEQSTATDDFNSMYEIPDNLKVKEKYIKEDNVTTSLSMLTSIQEVDLGIENKLKNIEATEKATKKLEEEKKKKKNTVKNLIGVSMAAERFYNAKTNDRRYDRMFYDKNKNKDQNIKDSDDNMSQKEMSKNPIINKINRANNQNYNSNKNKHNNNNNDISSSHNSSGRNYDKRNMATDDIAFERFKKRFRR
ncbi:hepatocellular carcinoma-associated antigen 59-domain-containing protein [Neocallimastix sp. 'constans']|jgi:hypothetical protein